jgi:hypothetical protein
VQLIYPNYLCLHRRILFIYRIYEIFIEFVVTLLDECSRHLHVEVLKKKSEFENFFKLSPQCVNYKLDCDFSVFDLMELAKCGPSLSKFISDQGIIHERTHPYVQEKNGLIERFNRTLIEKVANIHNSLWPYAVRHAALLYNITPHSALQGTSDSI